MNPVSVLRTLLWCVPVSITLVVANSVAQTNRYALLLGNNQGNQPERTLQFAERDAHRLFTVLTELGGFTEEQTTLLLGADADQAWHAIRSLEKKIVEQKAATGQKSLFVFYFSGHATGDALELGSTILRFENLLQVLKDSRADVRLAFLDSCKSGRIVAMKNGGLSSTFHITDQISANGYGIITSSAHNELSQESTEIGGAYFTHYLISALRGAADTSKDGRVTLAEAYDYAYAHTLSRTSTTIGGSQHPMYHFKLAGRGEIVLTRTEPTAGSGFSITLPESGRLILLDEGADEIVAEIELKPGETARLAAAPGTYIAYLLTPDNATRRAESTVESGQFRQLDSSDFLSVRLERSVAKGGLFSQRESSSRATGGRVEHTLDLGGQWRRLPIEIDGLSSSWGATLGYRLSLASGWQPLLVLNWTTLKNTELVDGYHTLGGLGGLGYVWRQSRIALHLEALVGYEQLWQQRYRGTFRHTSGFNYLGQFGLAVASKPMVFRLNLGGGGRIFQLLSTGWVHRLDLLVGVSLGYRWGGSI